MAYETLQLHVHIEKSSLEKKRNKYMGLNILTHMIAMTVNSTYHISC